MPRSGTLSRPYYSRFEKPQLPAAESVWQLQQCDDLIQLPLTHREFSPFPPTSRLSDQIRSYYISVGLVNPWSIPCRHAHDT